MLTVTVGKYRKGLRLANNFLQAGSLENVFAVSDYASMTDLQIGLPCPPTAQHAISQDEIQGMNIASLVKFEFSQKCTFLTRFDNKTRGTMATVGKRRDGVILVFK